MQITHTKPKNCKREHKKSNAIESLGKGITESLLEKYKPKGIHNIERITNREYDRRVD